MSRALPALIVVIAAAAGAALQEPSQDPLPEGVVATLDGRPITLAEYQDFLWRQTGKRMLPQMADELLLDAACARFGVVVDEEVLEARVEERVAQLVQGRVLEDVEREMRARGYDLATLRANLRAEFSRTMRLDALVLATRIATDERLRVAFDAAYGQGGVRVELRQVLVMPHVLRAERVRDGADPASLDLDALRAEARDLADSARSRILAGVEFGAVAEQFSHDQASREQGGVLGAYRPGLYGEAFGDALRALEVGEISAVLESPAGFHVVEVLKREVTEFHRVREELVRTVMDAEPSWQEREEVLAGLRARSELRMW